MRYYQKDIVFQEVPGEISLCYFICGCPLRCEGCHSPFTWNEKSGRELRSDDFLASLCQYEGMLSCVLFMGGEWHEAELIYLLRMARERGLKTCLYSGRESVSQELMAELTFLKTGPWVAALGGLDSPRTNQRFQCLETGFNLNQAFIHTPLAV